MKTRKNNRRAGSRQQGFSLIELMIAMTITLVLMAAAATLLRSSLGTRERESRRTDALTSAQAALNVMSREIANAGYGLGNNGIVLADSGPTKLRFRANIVTNDSATDDPGEDVMYFYDQTTQSIVRYDRYPNPAVNNEPPEVSYVVNRISEVKFEYYDYTGGSATPTKQVNPTVNTGRVRIIVKVKMDPAVGQPDGQEVKFSSDVTLRNSN